MAWLAKAPRPTPRVAIAGVVIVLSVAIGAGLLVRDDPSRRPPTSPGPSVGTAGTTPAATVGVPPGISPGTDWAAVDLAPLPAAAALEPGTRDDTGVPADVAFTLTSLAGEPVADLGARLQVSPPIRLLVTPSSQSVATVKPAQPLAPGHAYRVALRSADGSVAGSWFFRVRGPVAVTSTIPGNRATGVPLTAAVEVAFDQEGVADMADHFTISPKVSGRFERHGRTQVFVPDSLKDGMLYTVTIGAGLARTGTDLALPSDFVFSFETSGPDVTETQLRFGRDVIEASPTEKPVVALRAVGKKVEESTAKLPTSAVVRVYRLPSLAVATRSLSAFLSAPRWSTYTGPLIPTDGLTVAASFTATLEPIQQTFLLIRFPTQLPVGWYVVEIAGARKSHAFLQVTPVSAWVSVLTDKTVVWINDVATGGALRDATVALGDAPAFAHSTAQGLAIGATPAALEPPADAEPLSGAPAYPILKITSAGGDTVLVPFDVGTEGAYRGEWSGESTGADATYWSMLSTDRNLYRTNDRIEVWGYLRARDGLKVPSSVELRLVSNSYDGSQEPPTIETVTARPGASGMFTAALPLSGAALGSYQVQAVVGGRVVVSHWLDVAVIRKPAYRLELTTDRQAVIVGTPVRWTTAATFFDGTPVPSLEVALEGEDVRGDFKGRTNAQGRVTMTMTADASRSAGDHWEEATGVGVNAIPTGPESAEIMTSQSIVVFPTAYDLRAEGVVKGGRLHVSGSLHRVDLAKVERQIRNGTWAGDAAGAAVPGRGVLAVVTELVPVKHLVGNEYDFVAKVVRPRYEYDTQRKPLRTLTLRSAADGRLTLDIAVPDASHEYEVVLSANDAGGRLQRRTISAGQPVQAWWAGSGIVFETADGKHVGSEAYGVGQQIVWRMIDEGRTLPSGARDRYLYIVAQRGLRGAAVTDTSSFRHTFKSSDAPGIFIIGVRFNGSTYAPKAAGWANFDHAGRAIKVTITADRARYRPGQAVTLAVRTTRPNGTPVAASVVVKAIDEKIYAINGASESPPLDSLYGRVASGILRLTATHQVPSLSGAEGEGGDTTGGGGERGDFKDTLLFREVTTDASGRARLTAKLSDDLTSWRVTATAVTAGLGAGSGTALVPVGLPFFVEATVADTYLMADRPTIRLRAFGDSLRAGDRVEFEVRSESLGMAATKVTGKAFEAVGVKLPALSLGARSVEITATAVNRKDSAGKPLSDRLIGSFTVVTSRLTAASTSYSTVGDGLPAVAAGPGLATYTFADAGRGRFLPILLGLAEPGSARLDELAAQAVARQRLMVDFGRDAGSLPPTDFDPERYKVGTDESADGTPLAGAALLPYGGVDPWLAARIAVLAPNAVDESSLREALTGTRENASTKRDLSLATLAGLAALGDPVMEDLRAAARATDLSPTEQIYLALGFQALGDDAGAARIERDLLARYGERLGPWVRLRQGDLNATADASLLLSAVAASLGDPVATGLVDYGMSNPARESTQALELAAYASRGLERTPASAASFAYTVAGKRSVVTLGPGETLSLTLTADQQATLAVDTISGKVGVALQSRTPVQPGALKPNPALTLSRAAAASLPANRVVAVNLTAKFAEDAPANGCYDVTELVPSGLAPMAIGRGATDEAGLTWPSGVSGQTVTFCASNDARSGHTARMRYMARVVNPGTFTWEPAIMQLAGAPEMLAITPAGTTTIAP